MCLLFSQLKISKPIITSGEAKKYALSCLSYPPKELGIKQLNPVKRLKEYSFGIMFLIMIKILTFNKLNKIEGELNDNGDSGKK
ncbi:hypothetical protein QF028_000385 [Neobacillus sp. B4I6]